MLYNDEVELAAAWGFAGDLANASEQAELFQQRGTMLDLMKAPDGVDQHPA